MAAQPVWLGSLSENSATAEVGCCRVLQEGEIATGEGQGTCS